MTIYDLATPATVLDMDSLESNVRRYQDAVSLGGKQLWPMTKTHKSTALARLQIACGATGLLCGTLDECEAFASLGVPLMYAYPPAGKRSIERVIALANRTELILRLDGIEAAEVLNAAAKDNGITLDYTLIIDSGLNRFGVEPKNAAATVQQFSHFEHLRWRGISTHPGQVYGASRPEEIVSYIQQERNAAEEACRSLEKAGLRAELITSGSTPTCMAMAKDSPYTVLHPGNYIFHDAIQLALGVATERDCALRVIATVIAHPAEDRYIIDAGAKCLGLDQGAHGCASVKGFGAIVDHPELTLYSLSEEVGKIHVDGETSLKVGDRVAIIPNHSCSSANLTSYYHCVRGDAVKGILAVDVRGNSTERTAL